jgi:hypothetical protein
MRDAILFLMGTGAGSLAGWIVRDVKVEWDKMRREDHILRTIQDRLEREGKS